MIDEEKKIIYIDYSMSSTFGSCKEKERLAYEEGWTLKTTEPPLAFGHAFHAAIAAYYDALAGGHKEDGKWITYEGQVNPLQCAQLAFLKDLKYEGASLPNNLDSEERRSVERGLGLVEAYITRWKSEPYDNVINPDNGEPYTEIGFSKYLFSYGVYSVVYVGRIDRIMRNRSTGREVIFETKTTTQGLKQYVRQVKPNHQVSGYFYGIHDILPEIKECVWDCVFVSSRKADVQKAVEDPFWMYGIDIKSDFARQTTLRGQSDIEEFQYDITCIAEDYCRWLTSHSSHRWPRNTGACHGYGGCKFRDVCSVHREAASTILNNNFTQRKWEPWKGITTDES